MHNLLRNIALFAHVDAGKTSITEQLLFQAGIIQKIGSVDTGDTQTDTLNIEKQRGISVQSSILGFDYDGFHINLIDTPGHVDFSAETSRAIRAIDAAIVIISAVEGIQAQTERLLYLLKKNHKPILIFINKIDRMGADSESIIQELQTELNIHTFSLNKPEKEAENDVSLQSLWDKNIYLSNQALIEQLVSFDDMLMTDFLSDKSLSFERLNQELINQTREQNISPLITGSAKLGLGIPLLLKAIVTYLPKPKINTTDLSGIVFKTFHTPKEGKWSVVRIFSGSIQSRKEVYNATQKCSEKITSIKSIYINDKQVIDQVNAGEIVLIQGFNQAKPGDFLGNIPKNLPDTRLHKALLSVQLYPKNTTDTNLLLNALQLLHDEDPELDFVFYKEESEFHIRIYGEIQKEILQSILLERFNITVSFSQPSVIYKETPTIQAEGYVRYWMPKPCWAIMRFNIEPAPRGSGVHYQSNVGVNDIKRQYQNDIIKTLPKALEQGILGWEVTDINITLIEGEDHEIHTKSNDFSIATPMGIMDALQKAKMALLEPILEFKIKAPPEYVGKINSELIKLRAHIEYSEIHDLKVYISGRIPLATSLEFPIKLSAITSGKGHLSTRFSSYEICDIKQGKTRDYKGISPLDRAKYILKARKAIQ